MKLHPQLIEKDGKKEFVILPYDEFLTLEEIMNNYEDLQDLRKAKEGSKGQKGIPLDQVVSDLGL